MRTSIIQASEPLVLARYRPGALLQGVTRWPDYRANLELLCGFARFVGVHFRRSDHVAEFDILQTARDAHKQGDLCVEEADSPLRLAGCRWPAHTDFCHNDAPGAVLASEGPPFINGSLWMGNLLNIPEMRKHSLIFHWQSGENDNLAW